MEYVQTCWNSCGNEFTVHAPDRQDSRLIEGVRVQCEHCTEPYKFTVDGDGEPSLESFDSDALGENVSGHGSEDSTHY